MFNLLNEIIDVSAKKYGDKIAVEDYKGEITYRGLYSKSEYMRDVLLTMDLDDESVIGVYLEKSIESIISFLGILKTGLSYIPLDTYHTPISRIKKIVEISEMDVIITNDKNISAILKSGEFENIKIINIDEIDFLERNKYEPTKRVIKIEKDDLAYILYTSGSTGEPKGVIITHLNALTFINWSLEYFKPEQEDIFSSIALFTFDLSVFDIYVSLASGGKLSILPNEKANNPRGLLEWLLEKKITYIYSVPSLWINLLNYTDISNIGLPYMKKVLFAGEVFQPRYLKKLVNILPGKDFYNLYGPTETNVCTCFQVNNETELGIEPIPIGSPCNGTNIIVVNKKNELVNIGEEGELMVSGPIVTKGYFKNKGKTETAFLKFNNIKYYKTGDIVKKSGENLYTYVRRNDSMIKHMGYRIELNEIEHIILKNNKIEEAVVVLIPVDNEKTIICSVIKAVNSEKIKITEIKEFIGGYLPRYMIPEFIMKVDEIPKNNNGKKDMVKIKEMIKNMFQ